jgi:hypothetical protein
MMVANIDKIQLAKLEVEQLTRKMASATTWIIKSIGCKAQFHVEVYGTRYFWANLCYGDGLCKRQ